MSPSDFTFKLSVPNDPAGTDVVAVVARHAIEYAKIDAARGAAFVDRVVAAAAQAMTGATGAHCAVVFAAGDGQLTMTIGGQSVSEPLPA